MWRDASRAVGRGKGKPVGSPIEGVGGGFATGAAGGILNTAKRAAHGAGRFVSLLSKGVCDMAGYNGWSMSNNAVDAYSEGKAPLSVWTKAKILSEIKKGTEDYDVNVEYELLSRLSLAKLRALCLVSCEYHHTSKYYNRTDFYEINWCWLEDITADELSAIVVADKAERAAHKQDNKGGAEAVRYRADVKYIEWSGTRNYPKRTNYELNNVWVEERGCFFVVYDDNGKELVRKKMGSNGTYVVNLEERAAERARAEKAKADIINNSTERARALLAEWTDCEHSSSGRIYKRGRKPTPLQYDDAASFFEVGELRLSLTANRGGYLVEEWDGSKWVAEV